MKVKELLNLLKQVDENIDVYIETRFGGSDLKRLTIKQYSKSFFFGIITQEIYDKEFQFRKEELENCKAKKSTREYKDCLQHFEAVKNDKLIPVVVLE